MVEGETEMTILLRNPYTKPYRIRVPKTRRIVAGALFWHMNMFWRVDSVGREGSTVVAHIHLEV